MDEPQRDAEKTLGELAMMLLQDDRQGALDWACGVKVTFPDGAPRVPVLSLEDARELAALRTECDALRAALRKHCIGHSECAECGVSWMYAFGDDYPEEHKPGCLAALQEQINSPEPKA
jgi:hypothetical protein